ncbi:MAG: cell division protein FtsL [Pseudomonadales bacterium]|nr:cell division protein FtsL [Pseudomonadales bacterium]
MNFLENKKLPWVLWLAISATCFAVILTSYNARQRFIEWQFLLSDAQAFEVEWGQLLLEKSTMASYSRLEQIAADKLNMTAPSKQQIVVVKVGY